VQLEDFARFVGHEAKLETTAMVEGRRRFKGAIIGVQDGSVRIALPEGEATLPFAWIADARLVLTDRLIAEDLKRAAEADRADADPPSQRKSNSKTIPKDETP
jgi:ribosome maturation factor RimP